MAAQYLTIDAIKDHLYAQSPCSERSLISYCLEQCTDDVATNFAAAMTTLIESGAMEYVADEDGDFYIIGEA